MAFTSITPAEITEGEVTKQQIYRKIRDNFAAHESRLIAMDGGNISGTPTYYSGFISSSTSYVDVPGSSVDVLVKGHSVLLNFQGFSYFIGGLLGIGTSNTLNSQIFCDVMFKLSRQSVVGGVPTGAITDLAFFRFSETVSGATQTGPSNFRIPASSMKLISQPGAGTWRYKIMVKINTSGNVRVSYDPIQIVAVEL